MRRVDLGKTGSSELAFVELSMGCTTVGRGCSFWVFVSGRKSLTLVGSGATKGARYYSGRSHGFYFGNTGH